MTEGKKHLVVLSGAGISAESGLQTFRDQGGLWEKYDWRALASVEGWTRHPERVLEFYNIRRKKVLEAQPNLAHRIIAELEKAFRVTVITQNVDNLHERAGSTCVIHIHGEILKARCTGPCHHLLEWKKDLRLGDTCKNGYQLRPHVVWFGEAVLHWDECVHACSTADIFVIIGTSLSVYPAASLVHCVPSYARKFLIDQQAPAFIPPDTQVLKMPATRGASMLKEILGKLEVL